MGPGFIKARIVVIKGGAPYICSNETHIVTLNFTIIVRACLVNQIGILSTFTFGSLSIVDKYLKSPI